MDVSTISNYEYALMNATWLTLSEPQFQCELIEEGYKKRKDAEVVINYRRIEQGCGKYSDSPRVEIDGISYYSCLCHEDFKDVSLNENIWLYNQFKSGNLAFEGGLMDQPAKYVELMRFLDRLHAEMNAKVKDNGK